MYLYERQNKKLAELRHKLMASLSKEAVDAIEEMIEVYVDALKDQMDKRDSEESDY